MRHFDRKYLLINIFFAALGQRVGADPAASVKGCGPTRRNVSFRSFCFN